MIKRGDKTGKLDLKIVLSIIFLSAVLIFLVDKAYDSYGITGLAAGPGVNDAEDTWSVNQKDDLSKCGEASTDYSYQAQIAQDLSTLTYKGKTAWGDDLDLYGNLKGYTLDLQGSFLVFGGTATIESSSINVAGDCKSFEGTFVWSWSDGRDKCPGSSRVDGTRLSDKGCRATVVCEENWQCGEWSECSPEGIQKRTCTDANSCGTEENKLPEERSCTYTAPAAEEPTPAPEKGLNYSLIGGVVAAVLIIAGIFWYLLNRKKSGVKAKTKLKTSKKSARKK